MTDHLKDDLDPQETREWLDALEVVLEEDGPERGHYLLESLIEKARRSGAYLPYAATTAYLNTIPASQEPTMPGDQSMEARVRAAIRWNALAMVLRASKKEFSPAGIKFRLSAMLYDIGFNHFFRAPTDQDGGDFLFIQGHASPGIYARAYPKVASAKSNSITSVKKLTARALARTRSEINARFLQFPTVSMGLGQIQAIYQARYLKYLTDRGIKDCSNQRVYAFLGDGEVDEPETLGAISLATREGLDNLTFIVNCNLQRLDGPVRGNGKIIQELEGTFRGAGWEVIKVIWGRYWDPLLYRDTEGKLAQIMQTVTVSTRTTKRKVVLTPVNTSSVKLKKLKRWLPTCRMKISGV